MTVNDTTDSALAAINKAAEASVLGALGGTQDNPGRAPAYNKGVASFLKRLPEYFGESGDAGFCKLFGIGEESANAKNQPDVFVSHNFRAKSGNSHIPAELLATGLELKKLISDCQMAAMIESKKLNTPYNPLGTKYFKNFLEPKLKAFDLAGFAQWIPQLNTRFYFEEVEIEPGIEAWFETIAMQSKSEQIPGAINRLLASNVSDGATFVAKSNTSAGFVWTASDFACHTDITEDLIQDATPSIFERLRKEVVYGIARSTERCILNGDNTATHFDNDSQVAKTADATLDVATWKGLRRILADAGAGMTHDNAGASVSIATLSNMLTKLGKFGKDKSDLMWILGPSVSTKIITGGIPEILIVQNVSNNATLLTGSLFPIFGVRPYESEWMKEDLSASGVNTLAGPNNLTSMLLVKRSRFMIGERSPIKVWATPSLANQDKMLMTAKRRLTFAGIPQSATENSISGARNIALS